MLQHATALHQLDRIYSNFAHRLTIPIWIGSLHFFSCIFTYRDFITRSTGLLQISHPSIIGLSLNGCGIVLGILFFFRDFFFLVGGGFRAVQAPFWGNQWWNAGSIQVWTQKLLQKANCPVHFCFLCVFIYVDVCVCVCDRVCSMCFRSVVVLIFHSMHFFSYICNLSI